MKDDKELDPELYRVAREKGTEAPFTGKYVDEHTKGMYACAVCGQELFSSDAKFDSGTGWPAFAQPVAGLRRGEPSNVVLTEDTSDGMIRTEVTCKNCGAHLGHVFDDLPAGRQVAPHQRRYCINSVCLDLKEV